MSDTYKYTVDSDWLEKQHLYWLEKQTVLLKFIMFLTYKIRLDILPDMTHITINAYVDRHYRGYSSRRTYDKYSIPEIKEQYIKGSNL